MGRILAKTRWTEANARRVLEAQAGSGLTMAEYARREGLGTQRLYWWARRLSRFASEASTSPRPFVEVVRSPTPLPLSRASVLEIVLACGRRVRVEPDFDADSLRRLLDIVDSGVAC